jgi:hypothetical protein
MLRGLRPVDSLELPGGRRCGCRAHPGIVGMVRTGAREMKKARGERQFRDPGGGHRDDQDREQAQWMPKVIDFSLKGVFSLTEPESDDSTVLPSTS